MCTQWGSSLYLNLYLKELVIKEDEDAMLRILRCWREVICEEGGKKLGCEEMVGAVLRGGRGFLGESRGDWDGI